MDLLIELCKLNAIAGNESSVREFLIENLSRYTDEILFDGLGSVIFRKKGFGPKVMFMAHMDEVGFIVKSIDKKGYVHVIKVGSVLDTACYHQKVRIGDNVLGILNTFDNELMVDVGVSSYQECVDFGVQIGDKVCFEVNSIKLTNNRLFAKSLDNRVGCYALMKSIVDLSKSKLDCDLYFAFTSSEEVGMRGGMTTTHLVQPDISFAIDVASEKKNIQDLMNTRILGQGFMIINFDKTLSPRRSLIEFLRNVAQDNNLKYQDDMFGNGGTDAGTSHTVGSGRLSSVLGIPLRECHGPYSLCDMNDVNQMVSMIVNICKKITADTLNEINKI